MLICGEGVADVAVAVEGPLHLQGHQLELAVELGPARRGCDGLAVLQCRSQPAGDLRRVGSGDAELVEGEPAVGVRSRAGVTALVCVAVVMARRAAGGPPKAESAADAEPTVP